MKETKKLFETYRKTDVFTANRETILLMMYAGALRFLKQAIQAAEEGNLSEKGKWIGKTQEIVNELRSTLNFEAGADIAHSLEALYVFVSDRLLMGGSNRDVKPLKEALGVLTTLNSAWEEAIAQIKKTAETE